MFVVNGMRNERQALKSGIGQIRGETLTENATHPENNLAGPVQMMVAFDGFGNHRLDRSEPGWIISRDNDGQTRSQQGNISAKSSRFGGKSVFWIVGQRNINLMPANFRLQNDLLRPFDPRILGFGGIYELQRGMTFEELLKQHLERTPPEIDESNPNLWELTWQFHNPRPTSSQWRVWIDTAHGFSPVRAQLRNRTSVDAEWRISQTVDTKWECINEAWVPVNFSLVSTPTATFRQTISYQITWTKVNETIDTTLFDFNSFGAPEYIGIVDSSLGQPVVIKPPGMPQSGWLNIIGKVGLAVVGAIAAIGILWLAKRRRRVNI